MSTFFFDNCAYFSNNGEFSNIVLRSSIDNSYLSEDDYLFVKGYSTPRGLYNTLYDNNGNIVDFCYGAEIKDMIIRNDCPGSFRYMKGTYNFIGKSPIKYKAKHGWYLKTIKDWWSSENEK